ncbi:MAG TPA: nitrite reductase small subunit NirD [Planctomycetota bacterium]|nr:nitrite reductase small subunit NirD [Planctomycetota bacterium]
MNAPLATLAPTTPAIASWSEVCALDDIMPSSGVCALIDGRQIAIVRVADQVYALSNFDPFSRAMVLSRGIVGDAKGVPKIASPVYKQGFDLRTGRCLDDAGVRIPTYPCRVVDGRVQVQA